MQKTIIKAILVFFVMIFFCGVVSAAEWNVTPAMGIQNAINNASDGDTLSLSAGTYYEHNITVNKSLTILDL